MQMLSSQSAELYKPAAAALHCCTAALHLTPLSMGPMSPASPSATARKRVVREQKPTERVVFTATCGGPV